MAYWRIAATVNFVAAGGQRALGFLLMKQHAARHPRLWVTYFYLAARHTVCGAIEQSEIAS